MSQLVEFPLEGGGSVWVEAEEPAAAAPAVRGRRGAVEELTQAGQSFEQTLGGLAPVLGGLIERMRSAAALTEVQVEFGVKLSADANLIVARSGGEANFRLTARWAQPSRAHGEP
jgi:NTP-dependent ternary system trypsin peptidase co-occuring protein